MSALDTQIAGSHYKDSAIQPIAYIHANKLGFIEGNIVKYVTRHRDKNGAEDIRKIIHYCQLLLELEYSTPSVRGGTLSTSTEEKDHVVTTSPVPEHRSDADGSRREDRRPGTEEA